MNLIRTMPPGAPVALLALATYMVLTTAMPPGGGRTGLAASVPAIGCALVLMAIVRRLQRVGTDPETTRRLFDVAAAFVVAAPVLALAVHMAS